MRFLVMLLVLGGLAGCQESVRRQPDARILLMGDSMMAWNDFEGRSVPDVIEQALGQPVVNVAVRGARMNGGGGTAFDIRAQYKARDWDMVILNGGANDLIFKCNCDLEACASVLDAMISPGGDTGVVPSLVTRIRGDGGQVYITGYHRTRSMRAPLNHCKAVLNAFDDRLAKMAAARAGVSFVNLQDVFPPGDTSFYATDRIHPSPKGSRAIAERILSRLPR